MSSAETTNETRVAAVPPIVSVEWLRDHRDDSNVLVFDVRGHDAYDDGHIPGARHLDLSVNRLASSDPEAIETWVGSLQGSIRRAGIAAKDHVVFYEEFSGTMAAYGVWLLDAAGLGNGSMLDGGFLAWSRESHDVSIEDVSPAPTDTAIQFNPRVLATAGQIMTDLAHGSNGARRIDTRAETEVAQGAIPGSDHLDWRHHLDEQGAFRPLADLARLYESFGLDKSDRIASYCAGGIRAANTYVLLKALGYEHPQNYAPSWGEWGSRPDTPVE